MLSAKFDAYQLKTEENMIRQKAEFDAKLSEIRKDYEKKFNEER